MTLQADRSRLERNTTDYVTIRLLYAASWCCVGAAGVLVVLVGTPRWELALAALAMAFALLMAAGGAVYWARCKRLAEALQDIAEKPWGTPNEEISDIAWLAIDEDRGSWWLPQGKDWRA